MANDWIKMRAALLTSPKVNGIARYLESDPRVAQHLTTGFHGLLGEVVTRNVTRYISVTALLLVWSAANEHTRHGVFENADLTDIDDIAGIPCFGDAMASVGWAVFDKNKICVVLPNFAEYNVVEAERKLSGAERTRRYRERKAQGTTSQNNVTSDASRVTSQNVTGDVTCDSREDKRRIDKREREDSSNYKSVSPTPKRNAATKKQRPPTQPERTENYESAPSSAAHQNGSGRSTEELAAIRKRLQAEKTAGGSGIAPITNFNVLPEAP